MDTKELTIGKKVAYVLSSACASKHNIRFGTIEKIYKDGRMVLTNGLIFNERLKETISKADPYPRGYMMSVIRAEAIIADEEDKLRRYLTVQSLLTELENKKTGNGNYIISDEVVDVITTLTELLRKKG